MKELDFFVLVAVFQEMLGWLFWPLIIFIALVIILFVSVIVRDRGINGRLLMLADLFGIVGGFVAIWLVLAGTDSELSDMGGPIDWLLLAAIWLAGVIGTIVVSYIVLAMLGGSRRSAASGPASFAENKAKV